MVMFKKKKLLCLLLVALLWPGSGQAQQRGGIALIRDAEIEQTLDLYLAPILKAAGLSPTAVRIYIVNDPNINAFVAGGQNVFIHTGLIRKAESPLEVIGVMAHEMGHVAGAHLVRRDNDLKNLSTAAIASYVLGAVAAIGGNAAAGGAVMLGGTQLAQRTMLSYTRSQEQAADQAGVTFLNAAELSPSGLLQMMQTIDRERSFLGRDANPYLQTHPLPQQRIAFLERMVAGSPYRDTPPPADLVGRHQRMLAKLRGFLDAPAITLKNTANATAFPDLYARLIALYRLPDLAQAELLYQELAKDNPRDPFLPELRGQMLLENGDVAGSLGNYQLADRLAGGQQAMIRLGLARSLLAQREPAPAQQRQLVEVLTTVTQREPNNTEGWRMLAQAYGQQGQEARAALALAEKSYVEGDTPQLKLNIRRAESGLKPGETGWLRLQDLKKALAEDDRFK